MKTLEDRVLDYIEEMRLLTPGDRVGVAVSAGADSVALLRILHGARQKLGVALLVAHFDHCLRGAESEADARFVADLARRFGLRFIIDREDVSAAAKKNKWNLEDAARRLRYAFFERLAREGQANRIAVAHTADDQAETVLGHLIRGTGPTGLAGIYPVAGSVVRPLLCIRRRELREYLRTQGESWREDSTNLDEGRLRARVRSRLVPALEREFSPQIVERLSELARLSREEQSFWNAIVEDRFRALVQSGEACRSIRAADLTHPMHLPASENTRAPAEGRQPTPLRAVTERLIRRIYADLRGSRQGLTARHVEQVIRLAEVSGGGRQVELPGGVLVEKSFGDLRFALADAGARRAGERSDSTPYASYAYPVALSERGCATIEVPELHARFRLKVIDWTCLERETRGGCGVLDAALLRMPLILRNWRPGDAYRPRGRRQIHKLKHMFAEGRIPVRDRAGWPILESAGRVAWARGMAPAAEFCAGDGTAAALVIEEERL
ncbi:MAG: tRNA lysidine(34) synthetase TilS [Acidobacteriota bacterium]|nr:tRNA lysidine(34) synthetase TilS [Acidobacteriota bacterium]